MPQDPRTVHIVSHTHWDREWYWPFHQFRVNLVRTFQEVLGLLEGDPDFHHFVMDGQSLVLEDYLQIHPQDAERIARQVAAGALSIGPWYILPDEFLVSAEATVRNLLIGHAVCRPLGAVQKVGYIPDSFGHIAQMPQILRGAGIDSFIYSRGSGPELEELGLEYYWEAPDGSAVLAIGQCEGYCNAGGLGYAELWEAHTARAIDPELAVRRVRDLFAKMSLQSNGDIFLLNNGCDHFGPQREFARIVAALRAAFPHTTFRHTGFQAYVDAIRSTGQARRRYRGELVSGRYNHILSGVWSARIYLKQLNDQAQTLLENYLEPLAAYVHFCWGRPYPQELITYAWKLLLQNHPHDSICGCSIDAVHQEMVSRFAGVTQTAEQILSNLLDELAPMWARSRADDRQAVLLVCNPLPVARSTIIERLVVLLPGARAERLALYDQAGERVPCAILDAQAVERFWNVDYRGTLFGERQRQQFQVYCEHFADRILLDPEHSERGDLFVTLQFAANLPPLGHAVYYLREDAAAADDCIPERAALIDGNTLENEFYRLVLHSEGSFDLYDKAGDAWLRGLNRLEDTEDIGDEYDYAASAESETLHAAAGSGRIEVAGDSPLAPRLAAEFDIALPVAIDHERRRRSPERVACHVRTTVCLKAGSRVVEIETAFDNQASDHRLRAEFPSGIRSDEIISDGQFYLNRRSLDLPDGTDWVQPPTGTFAQQEYTLVQGAERGLAVLVRGLPEVAAHRDGEDYASLSVTLLRAVGWLSRDDFATRKRANAGPTLCTPEAQCRGPQRFHYAVVPFTGNHLTADIKTLSRRYRTPAVVRQGVADQHRPGGAGLLQKTSGQTSISAIKRHETHDTLLVRLYNLTAEAATERLVFGRGLSGAWLTNLIEERTGELGPVGGNTLELNLGPHAILTVEVAFED